MDRILRPEGTVIFRDVVEVLVKIKSITDGIRWKSQIMDHESEPFNLEKILIVVKNYWTGEAKHQQNKYKVCSGLVYYWFLVKIFLWTYC